MKRIVFLALVVSVVSVGYATEKLQINPQAHAIAVEEARKIVPDTLVLDFSQVKEIYLDEFAILNDFEDGMLCVQDKVTGKCGFLNMEGEWAIPMSLHLANFVYNRPHFANGYCVYALRDPKNEYSSTAKWFVMDKKGKMTKLPNVFQCTDFTPEGVAIVEKKVPIDEYRYNKKIAYINTQGQEIMTSVYAGKQYMLRQFDTPPAVDVYPFYDGLSPYFDFVTNLWGFIDINGRKVVPAKYPAVHQFSEGLAAVQMPLESDAPLKWGFIDNTGKMVIAPRFSIEPNDFAYGYALVQKVSEAFVYIDKTGKVVSGEYERAENFYFGYAFVTDRETSTLHCINTDFEIANVGDECILMDDEYFWRGRKIHEYGAALDGYDFIGRRTRVLPWKYKGKEGDTHYSLAAQAAITSGPMIEIATDDYIAYADLNGKVIFALFRNEF